MFHHMNRPQGIQTESNLYFSGKHYLYKYKVEVSVSSLEFAVYTSRHFPGSNVDISIFRKELNKHKQLTKKRNGAVTATNSAQLLRTSNHGKYCSIRASQELKGCCSFRFREEAAKTIAC